MEDITQLTNDDVNFLIYALEFHKATLEQSKRICIRTMGKHNYEIAYNKTINLLNKLKD